MERWFTVENSHFEIAGKIFELNSGLGNDILTILPLKEWKMVTELIIRRVRVEVLNVVGDTENDEIAPGDGV